MRNSGSQYSQSILEEWLVARINIVYNESADIEATQHALRFSVKHLYSYDRSQVFILVTGHNFLILWPVTTFDSCDRSQLFNLVTGHNFLFLWPVKTFDFVTGHNFLFCDRSQPFNLVTSHNFLFCDQSQLFNLVTGHNF